MDLDKVILQQKRMIVNVDSLLATARILDGRKAYVIEPHPLKELFPRPAVRDIFLYEEGYKGGNSARIAQKIFAVGSVENDPVGDLLNVLVYASFRGLYSEANKNYAKAVEEMMVNPEEKESSDFKIPLPKIVENVQIKGSTLEISIKDIVKEQMAVVHKDDVVVYREGVLVVEKESGEEAYHQFGIYALKSDKDSLILN